MEGGLLVLFLGIGLSIVTTPPENFLADGIERRY